MKNCRQWLTLCLLLVVLFYTSGCFEVKTSTQVNRDGTLLRTQIISGDSAEVSSSSFPSPIDSTWTVTQMSSKEENMERVATKLFQNANDLTSASSDSSGNFIRMRAELTKRFLWLFTEFTYRETYLNYNPFRALPLSDYVSPSAFNQYFRHVIEKEPFATKGDSLALEDAGKRFEEWESRNQFEPYFAEFLKGVTALGDPVLTPAFVAAHKEEAYRNSKEYFRSKGAPLDSLEHALRLVFKSSRVHDAMKANHEGFASFEAKLSFLRDMLARPYSTSIIMPGLILETNAPTIEGTRATWKDIATYAYITDYGIWVKSRAINWWVAGLAGIMILAAVVLFVGAAIRKMRRRNEL